MPKSTGPAHQRGNGGCFYFYLYRIVYYPWYCIALLSYFS